MNRHLHLLVILTLFIIIPVISAQDDQPLVTPISYGMTINETITDIAFFDWWQLDVSLGDKIVVSMDAEDGLQPLLGLLDSTGELVARSDLQTVAEINGTAFLQYDALTEGQHTIIATREGRDLGTTTGSYVLSVNNRIETETPRVDPFMETEFRCDEWVLTNALTFRFNENVELPEEIIPGQVTEFYRFFVYGLDGFEPVIRLQSALLVDRPLDCTDSALATEGTQLSFPILDDQITVTEADADAVSLVTLTNSGEGEPLGEVAVTLGAKEGTSGRFILIMEGLAISDRNDTDEIIVRRGPFADENDLDIYAIGYPNSRLDPIVSLYDPETDIEKLCDDIGTDSCSDLIDIVESTVVIGEDGASYSADRFDSAVRFDNEANIRQSMIVKGRASTSGNYLLVFVGELPAR